MAEVSNAWRNIRRAKNPGIAAWETISPPNQGENNPVDAKAYFSDHPLVLIGNLDQVHFLKTATPGEMFVKAAEIMAACKPGGRFIFSIPDCLEANTPLMNVKAMIAGARSYADCTGRCCTQRHPKKPASVAKGAAHRILPLQRPMHAVPTVTFAAIPSRWKCVQCI